MSAAAGLMTMTIYLDNGASTRLCEEARAAWLHFSITDYANSSSAHRAGIAAEQGVQQGRLTLARALGCAPEEIFFTSGGTEADAIAILGAARVSRGKHVVASAIEHPAVLSSIACLEPEGYRKTLVPVDRDGLVDPEDAAAAVERDTCVASFMHVNNEIGTVQPVAAIAAAVRRKNPDVLIHVDAVQSFGKLPFRVSALGADLVSLSAHKLHGPKGVGALYVRKGVRLQPLWGGGGQQQGLRAGTENVAGIAGFAAAADLVIRELSEVPSRLQQQRDRLVHLVRAAIPDVLMIGHPTLRAPNNANLGFKGVPAEVLLHAMEERGVTVSAGAACASRGKGPSHVLKAIGLADDVGTIRVTLSRETTASDVDAAATAIVACVRELRS